MRSQVRPATARDAVAMRAIERAAGERFRDVGMAAVADDEPLPEAVLAGYADAGRAWVWEDPATGSPGGYVVADVVDGCGHIEQVSVLPQHQGRGAGRALVDRVAAWATAVGLDALTLTTFADVPWNAPLYRHLGFRDLDEGEIGPELRALRRSEARHGLDPATRVCMRLELAPGGHAGR